VGLGISLPILWFGVFTIDTYYETGYENYEDNIEKMKADILKGDNSPGGILTMRRQAAEWAQEYYDMSH